MSLMLQASTQQMIRLSLSERHLYSHERCSFLGIINYYHKFMSNLSPKLSPLYKLLRKEDLGT